MSKPLNLADIANNSSDRIVEFEVSEDHETLIVTECCDYYFSADLTKTEVSELIQELTALYASMLPAGAALTATRVK